MSLIAVARRYAEALADVAMEHGNADLITGELGEFAGLYQQSRDLRELIGSPTVSQGDKRKVLDEIIARTRPSETTANLLRILLRHYRLSLLVEVAGQFRREINRRRGIVPAVVTTATPIGESQRTDLAGRLSKMTGKQIELQFDVDPALIGGAVTTIGSVIYDGSIRTQLQTIKRKLITGGRNQ